MSLAGYRKHWDDRENTQIIHKFELLKHNSLIPNLTDKIWNSSHQYWKMWNFAHQYQKRRGSQYQKRCVRSIDYINQNSSIDYNDQNTTVSIKQCSWIISAEIASSTSAELYNRDTICLLEKNNPSYQNNFLDISNSSLFFYDGTNGYTILFFYVL